MAGLRTHSSRPGKGDVVSVIKPALLTPHQLVISSHPFVGLTGFPPSVRCLPLPKNCGTAGNPCCPSNTDSPHQTLQDKLNKKPFCKDGSTCFYFAPVPGLDNGDMYAANTGV